MQQTIITDNYNGALQKPLHTGFSATTTTPEVIKDIDLSNKKIIVTGGYAGIGLQTVKTFVDAGAEVWIPARDINKGRSNLKGINNTHVEYMDLANPDSIDAFAERFLSASNSLHILVNNAGIMWVPLRRDDRGYESQLSTNHLGHFQLAAQLWPALKNANGARVVNVSSFGHHIAPFNFDDPNFNAREYETLQAYGQSKTANNLFTVELDHLAKYYSVRSYALHPGSVYGTDLAREAPIDLFKQMGTHDANGNIYPEVEKKLKTTEQGAATTVWCATSAALNNIGGVYCEDCDVTEIDNGNIEHRYNEPSTLRGVKPYSVDADNAKRLWKLSEALTGITFKVD